MFVSSGTVLPKRLLPAVATLLPGTTNTGIKVRSIENPEVVKVLSLKPLRMCTADAETKGLW